MTGVERRFRGRHRGRPNVGKSALFNRLLRQRRSLVHDLPGMTRDVLEVEATLPDGRTYRLVDTGGFDPDGQGGDSRGGPREGGRRRSARPTWSSSSWTPRPGPPGRPRGGAGGAARRDVETHRRREQDRPARGKRRGAGGLGARTSPRSTAFRPSTGSAWTTSRTRSRRGCPPAAAETATRKRRRTRGREVRAEIALAVVGRPNVGKSSLVNALLGEERAIVSEIAGHDARLGATRCSRRRRARVPAGRHGRDPAQGEDRAGAGGPLGRPGAQADRGLRRRAAGPRRVGGAHRPGRGGGLLRRRGGQGPRASWPTSGTSPREEGAEASKRFEATVAGADSLRPPCADAPRVGEDRTRGRRRPEGGRTRGRQPPAPDHDGRAEPGARPGAPRQGRRRPSGGRRLTRLLRGPDGSVARRPSPWSANRDEELHFSESRRIENIIREAADFTGTPIRISRARPVDRETRPRARKVDKRKTAR